MAWNLGGWIDQPSRGRNAMNKRMTAPAMLSRRAMVAAVAVAAATPALAEDCHIGPPPHPKGPLVWMDMDQVEIDAAYDQSFYAPLAPVIGRRRAANSEAVR